MVAIKIKGIFRKKGREIESQMYCRYLPMLITRDLMDRMDEYQWVLIVLIYELSHWVFLVFQLLKSTF